MSRSITTSTKVIRNTNHLSTTVGDETVIINIELGKCFELDAVGRAVWERLGDWATVERIVQALSHQFAGDPKQMGRDILTFVNDLAKYDLVSIAPDGEGVA